MDNKTKVERVRCHTKTPKFQHRPRAGPPDGWLKCGNPDLLILTSSQVREAALPTMRREMASCLFNQPSHWTVFQSTLKIAVVTTTDAPITMA